MKELLELKKVMRSKKPDFIRTDYHKKGKISKKWRRPKGHQNKIRLSRKGYRGKVKVGFGTPNAVKDLGKEGLKKISVSNVKDLDKVKPDIEGIHIAKVGMKKKADIVKEAISRKISILNVKEGSEFLKEVEELLKQRKEKKKTAEMKKKEKEKAKEEKKKEKEEEEKEKEEEISDEEKEKQERREKEKTLIKKQ